MMNFHHKDDFPWPNYNHYVFSCVLWIALWKNGALGPNWLDYGSRLPFPVTFEPRAPLLLGMSLSVDAYSHDEC